MKLLRILLLIVTANLSSAYGQDYLPTPAPNLVKHTYYTLSYNEDKEQANWVYYTLTDSMILNSDEERSNRFKEDKMVATGSAKPSDYSKSGYDKGHLCPAGDMGFNHRAMEESFLMSNMSPQAPDFNRGIWKDLETDVRDWAKAEHKLYIVTGPIFKDDKGTIGQDGVTVPGYYYKVIYDPTDQPKMIAFVLPNEGSTRPVSDFAVSTDEVEQLTGFDFFSQLPDDQENYLESQARLGGWFKGYTAEPTPEFTQPEARGKAPDAVLVKDKAQKDNTIFFVLLVIIILVVIVYFNFKGKKRR
jgi:endonuclease G